MLSAYHRMTKEELIAEIHRLQSEAVGEIDLRRTVHELEVYREETRIQTEQLIESQRLLEESRDRYADLYEFAPLPYLTLSSDGVVQEINLTGTSFFGRERQLLLGLPFRQLVAEEDRSLWLDHLRRCRSGQSSVRSEVRLRAAAGMVPVEVFSRLSKPNNQSLFRTTITDLTYQKYAEDEIRKLNAQLERRVSERTKELERAVFDLRVADQRKNEFLAMLGHELRNPLAGITHAINLLKKTGVGQFESITRGQVDPAAESIRVMDRQIKIVTKLLNDLLDVARITQGKVTLNYAPTNLADVVQSAVVASEPFLNSRGHRVDVVLPAERLIVDCDPTRMEQVLQNLLHNAGKYTDPQGSIRVDLEKQGTVAVLRVSDTGIGMTEQELQSAFDLFCQSNSALNRTEGGLGVGLTLAKSIVELHGGTISARSAGLRQGSTIEIRLPMQATELEASDTVRDADETPVNSKPCRVLIVDDNRDAALLLSKLLTLSGHNVALAHDGLTGLQAVKEFRPEVILLDIGLPGMTGYEVAQFIRGDREASTVRLIAVTGYGSEGDRRRALESGFDAHLTKPVSPDELERVITVD